MRAKYPAFFPLLIGVLAAALAACSVLQPEPTPTIPPTITPTPVPPTPTPFPTATSTPTPEPTPEPVISFPPGFPCFIVFSQFTERGMDIFAAECNSGEPEPFPLTEHEGFAYMAHLAPDMQTLAYSFYDPETELENLWQIDLLSDDFSYQPVTVNGYPGVDYSWSADSRYVVFGAAQPDGGEMDVYRIEISTGAVANLTADSSVWDAFPQWSPVGNQIVFVSDRHEDGKLLDNLWLMDENGGSLQQLTFTDTWEESFPSWSPDGSRVAFFRWGIFGDESEGKPGLVVIDVASGTETVITADAGLANRSHPVWSPDGQHLAYLENALTDEGSIFVVSAGGGEPQRVTDLPGENYGISWSPDSEWIMFTHQTDREWRLYLVHRDGTGLRPLFDFDGNAFGEWLQTNRD